LLAQTQTKILSLPSTPTNQKSWIRACNCS